MEELELTNPQIIPARTTTRYKLVHFAIWDEPPQVVVHVRGSNDELVVEREEGPAARTLIANLNTANLATKSLNRRLLEWVAGRRADLSGTVSGTA